MIKYDVPLNLEQNDNMKELVKNIKPNSVVLEFGPSTGRLTRYIKEELKCDIYIVEIDPEAFEISRQYANDGICDDIETYSWKVMASHKVFDYVIFADVLEHLKNPEKVIEEVKSFINKDSKILVSIPNITHNAIVLQLLNQRFDYQSTGLLDNTHIHFFTKETAAEMFERVGYHMLSCNGTFAEPYNTELHMNYDGLPESVIDFLSSRDYGNLYQIIYEFSLDESMSRTYEIENYKTRDYFAKLYFDFEGSGFSEENSKLVTISLENSQVHVQFQFTKPTHIYKIAFSPLDNYWSQSLVENIEIDGQKIDTQWSLDDYTIQSDDGMYIIHKQKYIFNIDRALSDLSINYNCRKILLDEVLGYCYKQLLTLNYEKQTEINELQTKKSSLEISLESKQIECENMIQQHIDMNKRVYNVFNNSLNEKIAQKYALCQQLYKKKRFPFLRTKSKYQMDIKQYNYHEDTSFFYEKGICVFSNCADFVESLKSDFVILNFTKNVIPEYYYNQIASRYFDSLVYYSDSIINGQKYCKTDFSIDFVLNNDCEFDVIMVNSDLLKLVSLNYDLNKITHSREMILILSMYTQSVKHISEFLYSTELENNRRIELDILNKVLQHRYFGYASLENNEVTYNYIQNRPKISIIIPTKDGIDMLENCVHSILEISTYDNYEIIILNNNSEKEETFHWFEKISSEFSHIKVIDALFDFNWSKLNNYGIRHADGDVYIFLNNDTLVISPDWIERLANNALRPDVGVVGSLLLYEDNTIQHAGVVIGMTDFADHIFKGESIKLENPHFCNPSQKRNVLAVTGACMAISKKTIDEIGLFNDEFIICGSDVEICLRAYKLGFVNVYEPKSVLYHLESKSRDSYIPEIDFIMSSQHYEPYKSKGDPFFNKNLDYKNTTPKLKG